jgi:hypothetical protein
MLFLDDAACALSERALDSSSLIPSQIARQYPLLPPLCVHFCYVLYTFPPASARADPYRVYKHSSRFAAAVIRGERAWNTKASRTSSLRIDDGWRI